MASKKRGYDRRNLGEVRGFVGEARRSKLVMDMGPGAIVDLAIRPSGEPVSGVVAGLADWFGPGADFEVVREVRLISKHNLRELRAPPLRPDRARGNQSTLPIVRFPRWLQCPGCKTVRWETEWSQGVDLHHPGRYCASCEGPSGGKLAVVPVRFAVACEAGHLDEFPLREWIDCTCSREDARLSLRQRSAGLAGLWLSCLNASCSGHKGRSMKGALGKGSLAGVKRGKCSGYSPWLGTTTKCDEDIRGIQRGASNAYWSKVDSALSIPPFSVEENWQLDRFAPMITMNWGNKEVADLLIGQAANAVGIPVQQARDYFRAAVGSTEDDAPMIWDEWRQFMKLEEFDDINEGDFVVRRSRLVGPELAPLVSIVGQAERLREVRMLEGFTRVLPPSGAFASGGSELAPLFRPGEDPGWRPAVELRGEGIFVALDLDAVREWEAREVVRRRVAKIRERAELNLLDGEEIPENFGARLLLVHSLSHALMARLTLSCGYSTSSLVERLYVGTEGSSDGAGDMAGLLIHTGTPDADGTLGGLVEQGASGALERTVLRALADATWCSSDPLCISGSAALSSPKNGAACHACQLVPETSCTLFNNYLDRATLVGAPGEPGLGFFEHLLG